MANHFSDEGLQIAYGAELENMRDSAEVFRKCLPSPRNSGAAHSGEEGGWTESLLAEFLRKKLPSSLEVSTGFIVDPERGTGSYQTDILVHDSSRFAPILRYGNAVIIHPKAVIAAISVKYKLLQSSLKKELEALRHIGDICNHTGKRGPYLALIGFFLNDTHDISEVDERTKWKKNADLMSRAIATNLKGFEKRESRVSTNEIVDTVATLDGYLMHASKGDPPESLKPGQQSRDQVLLLSGGAGASNFAIGAEIMQNIAKRTSDIRVWPGRTGLEMAKIGTVKPVVYGRPPSKASKVPLRQQSDEG